MEIRVKDEYRKNELSSIPGGSTVTAILKSGPSMSYDKIKSVEKYCSRLKLDLSIIEIIVNGESYWKRD